MFFLSSNQQFPHPSEADSQGCLAISNDLNLSQLKRAYAQGIFPWYSEGEPVIWWSPDPRMVLFPDELKISKSMRKVIKSQSFKVTFNQNFKEVITNCKSISRPGQEGTWISSEIVKTYTQLHKIGKAMSVEVWKDDMLVGGLYGVWEGRVFCGESMFAKVSNASKVGFIQFVQTHAPQLDLIDCQVYTDHLASLGAREIPRNEFLNYLDFYTISNIKYDI